MILGPLTDGHETLRVPILNQFAAWTRAESPLREQALLETWMARDRVRAEVLAEMRHVSILLCPGLGSPRFAIASASGRSLPRSFELLRVVQLAGLPGGRSAGRLLQVGRSPWSAGRGAALGGAVAALIERASRGSREALLNVAR